MQTPFLRLVCFLHHELDISDGQKTTIAGAGAFLTAENPQKSVRTSDQWQNSYPPGCGGLFYRRLGFRTDAGSFSAADLRQACMQGITKEQ
ncbi:hypothetical protein [Marinilabilia rubra]|uniref:Uncharacterized protein n=1 Tax=Marinilabilia rubra TaxID=2162893 RepID=A0A2U2B925_9BACT|nr:hypothetical protein [Marinilabilia rubra]PWD99552.1 hypothetical protein DDZ16_08840 [Marinilabilia rubra]